MKRNYTNVLSQFSALVLCLLAVTHSWAQTDQLGAPSYSTLKWNQIRSTGGSPNQNSGTIGLTTDKKMYLWGNNKYLEIHAKKYSNGTGPTMGGGVPQFTPYYVPAPAGETPIKVFTGFVTRSTSDNNQGVEGLSYACLTQSGKMYAWGVNNGRFGNAWTVVSSGSPTDSTQVKRVPTLVTIPGESGFVDMEMPAKEGWLVAIGASGKAYFNGPWSTYNGNGVTNFPQIPFPTGVGAGFKYTNVWIYKNGNVVIYLKGNNGNVYLAGQVIDNYGGGSPNMLATATGAYNITTDKPALVPFPAGEDIVKIDYNLVGQGALALALSASGKAYAAGQWRAVQGVGTLFNKYYQFPLKTVPTSSQLNEIIAAGDTTRYVKTFSEMPLPQGIGATKFIDIATPSIAGTTVNVVTDNNYVYWSGLNSSYNAMNNYLQYVDDRNNCAYYSRYATQSPTQWQVESINLRGTQNLFCSDNLSFILVPSGKGYVLRSYYASYGAEAGIGRIENTYNGYSGFPRPIANELLDACNPSPGTGGSGDGSTTNVASATGVIDCSKTQIVSAPIAGSANQHALVVTIAVSATGVFSPISVTGSGMSLANGVTQITANKTGTQQFQIPIYYNGTTLNNTFAFTIGQAGGCTADLSGINKKVVKTIYTLENCTTVPPGTLSK